MKITKEFAQQLVAYLSTKPYAEVYKLIQPLIVAINEPEQKPESKADDTPR